MEPSATAQRTSLRLDRVREEIARQGWSGLLVLGEADIFWLTGLSSSNAALVVTRDRCVVATDFRYIDEARSLGLEVARIEQSMNVDLGRLVGEIVGDGVLCYSPAALTHRAFLHFTDALPDAITLRAADDVVARLRAVKETAELDAIGAAASLLDHGFAWVAECGLQGRTEREVAWGIERVLREGGAERMSFDAIVAGGANGAFPHHSPGREPIPADTLVTVDIGCVVDGYCSDCTRTFAVGDPSPELRQAYATVLEAQEASMAAVRSGAVGREIDAVARTIIEAAGHGERFGHGLGHGVGREIHEAPRLGKTSSDVLEAGMVVTVEPGIYIPGVGGVRIEDLLVVTDAEPRVLTSFTKDLVTA